MSVAGHAPPPFFKRGPAPLVRLAFFVSLSLLLLIADLRFHTLEWARLAVATMAWPLQRITWLPIDAAGDFGAYMARQSTLLKENQELRRRQLETANLLLRQKHLESENKHLRALLDMRARLPVEGRIAEILYAARDPFSRRVIIDKGSQHGIAGGQAVVDDIGVIGQVARVFPLTAEVLLLTDKDQAIPVEVQRSGLRAVLAGVGAGMMELRFLASNAEVQVGDMLVTSGLDGVYLPGLPVAKVVRVDRDSAYSFARIVCAPLAGVERHGLALVLGARTALPPQPADVPASTDQPSRGKRVKKKAKP
ncbi:MAG: rod shape-determining protein MreC [Sulfuritalea sp.]|nr:rod shape-determining protein MreC [Sulfuritalea sp.]MDP1981823.1 rod shape-determining protein MreC [Sulfuritalea sp.]